MTRHAQRELDQLRARASTATAEVQAALDREWEALLANDPETVIEALEAARHHVNHVEVFERVSAGRAGADEEECRLVMDGG